MALCWSPMTSPDRSTASVTRADTEARRALGRTHHTQTGQVSHESLADDSLRVVARPRRAAQVPALAAAAGGVRLRCRSAARVDAERAGESGAARRARRDARRAVERRSVRARNR